MTDDERTTWSVVLGSFVTFGVVSAVAGGQAGAIVFLGGIAFAMLRPQR